jgi:hypothetical protein
VSFAAQGGHAGACTVTNWPLFQAYTTAKLMEREP